MKDLLTWKNIYLLSALISVFLIVLWAFIKTNCQWTNETIEYIFSNAFWAAVIILLDKFFHEKLKTKHDELKTKIDKLKGLIFTNESEVKIESIRLILSGDDEYVSASKAASAVKRQIEEKDPISKPGVVKLTLE
ncbi:hypothetical protein A2456_03330 [Candidatus Nomurabacteria bacterium RIFOXYC2_FULL_36_19]|uniref:Uncharacterized protein n=3 Tax=Candidatus Nomuraibacteriota TaxID=1752729 RepID=A0A1F6YV55_9BACT|nr:MAG: hypothetical protein UR91_C0021G0008 [Candidatus Nomurabacteria bacterium GW2011_GWC2_35_8]OGJ05684.1 MAG: hypothetical protein A2238_02215 [Candidatus Nomurabacteria bacterium RIFOXYA2_FULL_35_9]OGJ06838.1 MAG: hypothetical protein A2192_00090 [Candidatus Nomurabacteria bacterium RIFOXYA1_FULL_35_17]OGJ10264.1 MAG: hypothetical protein A2456_03330 [Candidatus Nomurabacteria bacterium RIFOXYC2_FULL_36_19]OGJ13763.1 MAG: hypothetical protein A2554_02315 [Candidatus Nomurabacteria bacteri